MCIGAKQYQPCQLHPFLVKSDLVLATHVLVTSQLSCCHALYMGLPLKMLQKPQMVQNGMAF